MGLIYMRTSPSGKNYIGQTVFSESYRWAKHNEEAHNPKSKAYFTLISAAIRKYGAENFSVQILEDNLSDENLDSREEYWIEQYQTFYLDNSQGYNMTRGGKGNKKLSSIEILTLWYQDYSVSEIAEILNASIVGISSRLDGLGISKENRKVRAVSKRINTVLSSNPYHALIKKLWDEGKCLTEISNEIHKDIHMVSRILTELYNISTEEIRLRKNKAIGSSKNKVIIQYDLDNNFIREWPSATIAAQQLKLDQSTIRKCIKGIRNQTGGYKWKQK